MPILDFSLGSLTYGLGDLAFAPGTDPGRHPNADETVFAIVGPDPDEAAFHLS